MPSLDLEAGRELFLLNLGVRSPVDIVRWVDAVIAKEEAPHELLIELSTTPPERLDRFISVLSDLRRGSDFWSAVRDAMPALHGYVVAHPEEAERIASSLFMTAAGDFDKMPKEFSFIYRFDDAFSLAHEGMHGRLEDVRSDFIAELKRFAEGPNQSSEPTSGIVTPRAEPRVAPIPPVAHL
jgi:hypothetical protein